MVDINDLWIGDIVILKKSGRVGKFSGKSEGSKLRVKVGDKVVITTPSNIDLAPEGTRINPFEEKKVQDTSNESTSAPTDTIDLHIEHLNPSMQNSRAERIVDYQVKAAKSFIDTSLDSNVKRILIIHGKGEGVLKSEVDHLLSLYDEVEFSFRRNNGGATEVWLK